jgi:hypothetical protein
MEYLRKRMWLWVYGECSHNEFTAKASLLKTVQGNSYKLERYYTQDDELFHAEGKTYAFTNQVGIGNLSDLDALIKKFPTSEISYCLSPDE